jgi:hypothetical protein
MMASLPLSRSHELTEELCFESLVSFGRFQHDDSRVSANGKLPIVKPALHRYENTLVPDRVRYQITVRRGLVSQVMSCVDNLDANDAWTTPDVRYKLCLYAFIDQEP